VCELSEVSDGDVNQSWCGRVVSEVALPD
jgi:hypothetical protein